MADNLKEICETLRMKYSVDESIYPKMSIGIDIPFGLEGEVERIVKLLNNMGFDGNAESVFRVMQMKRKLLMEYRSTSQGKTVLLRFSEIISEVVKPVGVTVPTDFLFVTGLTAVLLYLAGRFAGSFLDEAGKILARKLLTKDRKKVSEKLNLTDFEYDFIEKQVVQFLKDENRMELLLEDVREIISTKKKKKVKW